MFVNKIAGFSNLNFKGYQHVKNDFGKTVYRFNYPYDYDNEKCEIQFFKLEPQENFNYKLIEKPIASVELKKGGVEVDLDSITDLDKDAPFAYKVVRKDKNNNIIATLADSGIKIYNADRTRFRLKEDQAINTQEYSFVSRRGTTPRVHGAGYLAFPDSQRVGYKYFNFDDGNTGKIYLDENEQIEAEESMRTFSNKMGGNLAGLEYNLDYLASNGVKVLVTNPIAGGDNKSSHRYWNKNNFQIDDEMGNTENYASFTKKLFQNGMIYVYDGTYTSEGLEGIHFQYALRWAGKDSQMRNWFKMQGLKDSNLGLGVLPKNKENVRHRVINSPVIFDEEKQVFVENKAYREDEATFIQIYDGSQVSEEELSKLDGPIENYKKIKQGNFLDINTHDDTLISYIFQVDPKEVTGRYNEVIEFNKNNKNPVKINTGEGTLLFAQFSNFKFAPKIDGGMVTWDANTDMIKMNYGISGYDEKLNQAIADPSQKDFEKELRKRGAFEVQDLTLQSARHWTKKTRDIQTLYTAQVMQSASDYKKLEDAIKNRLLPEEALISKNAFKNVLDGYYELAPKGVLDKNDTTIKALMELPLDALEFDERTVGVLSTSFFSNRATSEKTLGLTRFELMKQENPHLINDYKKTYLKTNLFFTEEIKNFADKIIEKVNAEHGEKLLNEDGEYTEYGEYVIELLGQSIAKYAFLKSLMGDSLKTKILPSGEITYDYKHIKKNTTLEKLGVKGNSPKDEAEKLQQVIADGLKKLNEKDVNYLTEHVLKSIKGTDTNSFRLAEAIVAYAGLGLSWRLDAAKDIMDQDAGRNKDVNIGETWTRVIDFWQKFVQTVKEYNPDSISIAEFTDIGAILASTFGEEVNTYGNTHDFGQKFINVQEAMIKLFNETGIITEAAYDYFFTDLQKLYGPDLTNGDTTDNITGRINNLKTKIKQLINLRSIDYANSSYTFVGNHDKPRVLHGLALDMKLFHGKIGVFNRDGYADYSKNRYNRIEVMKQLTNADNFDQMPLEAKLNIDNPEYFYTVSTYATAMSQLLRNSINELDEKVATEDEKKYLKSALVDLTNGNYLGNGKTTQIPAISIPELSTLENALREMLKSANITLTEDEFNRVIAEANKEELLSKYYIHGDFNWSGQNKEFGDRNKEILDEILNSNNTDKDKDKDKKTDYMKYSPYAVAVAGLLRQAYLRVKSWDEQQKPKFFAGNIAFVEKFDRATVDANTEALPLVETHKEATAKDGYGSKDILQAIEMLLAQAEYIARKENKLAENEHFKNAQAIIFNTWRAAIEPGFQKNIMLNTALTGLIGISTIYGGDELVMSGYDEKTKNLHLQCRNTLPWNRLNHETFKTFMQQAQKFFLESTNIKNRDGVDALKNGTMYELNPSDNDVLAFLMQDGYGNMTITAINAGDVNTGAKVDYYASHGMDAKDQERIFKENGIETINPKNKYVPFLYNKDIDKILLGAGIALPAGIEFLNSDSRDNTVYVTVKDGNGTAIVKKEGGKIRINGYTARNGVLVLKHIAQEGIKKIVKKNINKTEVVKVAKKVAFRGGNNNLNRQYNIISNPYKKIETPIIGENLSILSK